MRIRKITTGWGTLFPTLSTVSRILCIAVFDAAVLGAWLGWLMMASLKERAWWRPD
jgi:hypothetical protein